MTDDLLARVRAIVERDQKAYLDTWCRLVAQPSISAQDVGVRECAELLAGVMTGAGLATTLLETPGYPVVFGERGAGPGGQPDPARPTILFYGHYDVQPPEPLDAWASPPFEPTVRDGRLYGRGTSDNKGQHLAHVLAVRALLEAGGGTAGPTFSGYPSFAEAALPANVKFLVEGEEENGSPHLDAFVARERERLAADVVVTSDGPKHHSGAPVVFFGVRGLLGVELVARGAAWDNHSGNKGGVVENPAWTLVTLLAALRDDEGRPRVPGFTDAVRPVEGDDALIRALPFDRDEAARTLGVPPGALAGMDGPTFYRRSLLEPTFNICGFTSGYGGPGIKTIIPAEARVKLDFRLVADQDPDEVFARVQAAVHALRPDVEVRHAGAMRPSRTPSTLPVCRTIIQAVGRAMGRPPLVYPNLGGSLPDAAFTRTLGLPSVGIPYANPDQANHSPNENMALDAFYDGIRISAQVIADVGAAAAR